MHLMGLRIWMCSSTCLVESDLPFLSYKPAYIIVTGFAKSSLPRTSNLPTLMIHNLRCVKVMNLKFHNLEH